MRKVYERERERERERESEKEREKKKKIAQVYPRGGSDTTS